MRDVVRAARAMGLSEEKPRKGSHWKFCGPGARPYFIPAHNGLKQEILDGYILGLCRRFGLDLEEFKSLL